MGVNNSHDDFNKTSSRPMNNDIAMALPSILSEAGLTVSSVMGRTVSDGSESGESQSAVDQTIDQLKANAALTAAIADFKKHPTRRGAATTLLAALATAVEDDRRTVAAALQQGIEKADSALLQASEKAKKQERELQASLSKATGRTRERARQARLTYEADIKQLARLHAVITRIDTEIATIEGRL